MIATLKQYAALILAALVMIALLAGALAIHHYGATRYADGLAAGRQQVLDDDARAAAHLQQQRDALNQFSAFTGLQLQHTLDATLPTIEASTHDTIETIRTVYRDRPAPAMAADACRRPDGVQQQLDPADGHL